MPQTIIRLPGGEWACDDDKRLGPPGGFGEVFLGRRKDGEVAVKRLRLTAEQAAQRELAMGQRLMERDLTHVVPIFDAGQDTDSDQYYLIMPVVNQLHRRDDSRLSPAPASA